MKNGEAFSHNAGLLSIAGKKKSLSMLNTCGVIDAGRREQLAPTVEDRGGSSYSGGREQLAPAVKDRGGSPYSGGSEQLPPAVVDRGGSSYRRGSEELTPAVVDRGGSSYGEAPRKLRPPWRTAERSYPLGSPKG